MSFGDILSAVSCPGYNLNTFYNASEIQKQNRTITFQIAKTDPGFNADTGVWTIKPTSRFSTMYSRHVVINGMSQSEFIGEDTNPFGPEIVISGESISALSDGISLVWSSLEMMHICINRF